MWILAASVASAQNFGIILPDDYQLVEGSSRIVIGNLTVGEVWTHAEDGVFVEIWASTLGPESMTAGFKLVHSTGPIDYDEWLEVLLGAENPGNLYDNWMQMCIEYRDTAPAAPEWFVFAPDLVTRKTFTVHSQAGGALGFVFGSPSVRGALQRETIWENGQIDSWIDYWVLLDSPDYSPPQYDGDTMWTLSSGVAQQTTSAFHTFWTAPGKHVKKYAQIGYDRETSSAGVDPDGCFF